MTNCREISKKRVVEVEDGDDVVVVVVAVVRELKMKDRDRKIEKRDRKGNRGGEGKREERKRLTQSAFFDCLI